MAPAAKTQLEAKAFPDNQWRPLEQDERGKDGNRVVEKQPEYDEANGRSCGNAYLNIKAAEVGQQSFTFQMSSYQSSYGHVQTDILPNEDLKRLRRSVLGLSFQLIRRIKRP